MIIARQKSADPWRHHKLLAIPFLTLVLAIVMYRNFLGTGTSPTIAPPPPRPTRVSPPGATVVTPIQAAKNDATQWPKPKLDEIIAKNPFGPWKAADIDSAATANRSNAAHSASIHTADSGEKSSGNEHAETLSIEKVQAVYRDTTGTAAIVDSHIIRPGDKLGNGLGIVQISDDGITVKQQQ
jgi:hypothetical protein